ncbi:MAG TPA: hypothetical protein VMX17_14070 [Candidatus Glassbacteria bacterium]|nr:hypothetical protein [Candidatus Glassbacteria bacterium]
MKNIINNYLNIINFLKIADLSDKQYRIIYNPENQKNDLIAFLNDLLQKTPVGEAEGEVGVEEGRLRSMRDLFLLSQPTISMENLINQKDALIKQNSNKNIADFTKKITYPTEYLNLNITIDRILEEKFLITISNNENPKIKFILENILESIQTKGNIVNFLIPYYLLDIDENLLLDTIKKFVNLQVIIKNKSNNGNQDFKRAVDVLVSNIVQQLLNIAVASEVKESVMGSEIERLTEAITIRNSNVFDFLKETEEWKQLELDRFNEEKTDTLTNSEDVSGVQEKEPEDLTRVEKGFDFEPTEFGFGFEPTELEHEVDRDKETNPAIKRIKPESDPEELTRSDIVASFTEAFAILKKF